MQIIESIKLALAAIKANKLRSSLTLLGNAIGLFSIIVVMTSIGAIQNSVEEVFNSIGTQNFIIQKMPAIRMGGHGSWRKYRNREDLTIAQGNKLKELTTLPMAIGISLNRSSLVAKYGNKSTNPDVRMSGYNLDAIIVNDLKIEDGRDLNNQDIIRASSVCVIGKDVENKLFPNISPIGQEIKIDKKVLTVIGTYEKKGAVLGSGQDNFITIPLTLYERYYGDRSSSTYVVMCESETDMEKTQDEVIGALRKIRKVGVADENDFEIVTNDQLINQFNDITKYFKIVAAGVAFIALLSAGIGIMNIMLVSVSERTKEIGVRKAIGAKKSIIRTQFVVEAIILSQIGGGIGIILGLIGGNLIAVVMGVSVVLPVDWIMIGLGVTTFVGLVFGTYPAIKASNLDPIEALRYE